METGPGPGLEVIQAGLRAVQVRGVTLQLYTSRQKRRRACHFRVPTTEDAYGVLLMLSGVDVPEWIALPLRALPVSLNCLQATFCTLLLAAGAILLQSWVGVLAITIAAAGLVTALAFGLAPAVARCTGVQHPNR